MVIGNPSALAPMGPGCALLRASNHGYFIPLIPAQAGIQRGFWVPAGVYPRESGGGDERIASQALRSE
jgi:hypothetical protein